MRFFPAKCNECEQPAKHMLYLMPVLYEIEPDENYVFDQTGESEDCDEDAQPFEQCFQVKLVCPEGHEWMAYAELPQERLVGNHLVMTEDYRGLTIRLTTEGRELLEELEMAGEGSSDERFFDLFGDFKAHKGWRILDADELDALTSCGLIITPDWSANMETGDLEALGRVYWHERYQVEDPIQELKNGGLFLERAPEDAFAL